MCVGSCLHLHNVLFMAEWSRKVGTAWGEGGYYFHPSDVQKAARTSRKLNILVLLAAFSIFILSDSLVLHFVPRWPLSWNSSVEVALKVGSTLVSEELFGLCSSRAELLCPGCVLLHSEKKYIQYCSLSCSPLAMPKWDIECCVLYLLT